jgi:hypothetical protein
MPDDRAIALDDRDRDALREAAAARPAEERLLCELVVGPRRPRAEALPLSVGDLRPAGPIETVPAPAERGRPRRMLLGPVAGCLARELAHGDPARPLLRGPGGRRLAAGAARGRLLALAERAGIAG